MKIELNATPQNSNETIKEQTYTKTFKDQIHVKQKLQKIGERLAYHHCSLGSIPGPAWRHMWVKFFVDSHPCCDGFSPGPPGFSPPQKTKSPNSNSSRRKNHLMDWPLLNDYHK